MANTDCRNRVQRENNKVNCKDRASNTAFLGVQ